MANLSSTALARSAALYDRVKRVIPPLNGPLTPRTSTPSSN